MIDFRIVPTGASGSIARPLLDVHLGAALGLPQTCLIDTGAAGIRLSAELARAGGISLPDATTGSDLVIGGVRSQRFERTQQLTVPLPSGPVTWRPVVAFCDPWPHSFGLLGLRGFFDRFDVLIQGADARFAVTPR